METLYFKLKNQERDEAGYRQRLQKHAACFLACAKFLDTTITLMHKNNPGDGKYQYAVVALLVLQIAEALDAMSVLVAQGVVDPCKSHLRTALEATLYVLYLLEADTERRALAYHVASVHKQLALYKKIDRRTQSIKHGSRRS